MQVLVHIGSPKAGSTTIQKALRENAPALAEQDILAWQHEGKGPAARMLTNRFTAPDKALVPRERLHFNSRQETIDASLTSWQHLAEEVARRNPALTIVSSEFLFAVKQVDRVLDALHEIFSDITVLAYIRDPAAHYRSELDQQIRDGRRLAELPGPLDSPYPHHRVVANYTARLGRERLMVRNFDRHNLAQGDLIEDLAVRIGECAGRAVELPHRPAPSNESLCAAATLWLLSLNETVIRAPKGNDREALKRRFALLRRLYESRELAALPKLGFDDPVFADWVRHAQDKAIGYYNDTFLADQIPLPRAQAETVPPEPQEIRKRMRDWLLGQADPAGLRLVLERAIMPV